LAATDFEMEIKKYVAFQILKADARDDENSPA
jgi:hypothetical protein